MQKDSSSNHRKMGGKGSHGGERNRVFLVTAAFSREQSMNVTWTHEQGMTEKQTGWQKNNVENFAKGFLN